MTTNPYLPNAIYAALTTACAPYALSHGLARRFQPDVIPFAGLAQPTAEALADLLPLLEPGEEIYLTADSGQHIESIPGLEVRSNLPGLQMRYIAPPPTPEHDPLLVTLTTSDTQEMLDLKARAFPGYFGPRAPELGAFFGIRDPQTGRLVAMGGERLTTFTDREISAVCTDPEYVGRGFAARIIRAVLGHQARLGSRSFLHVAAANGRAISLYQHLGFRTAGALDFLKLRRT